MKTDLSALFMPRQPTMPLEEAVCLKKIDVSLLLHYFPNLKSVHSRT